MRDWSYDKRYLWRFFEVRGIPRTQPEGRNGGRVDINFPYENRGEQMLAWLHDSLLWTIEMIEAGEIKLAFRGFIQATGYRAEAPGHGGSTASDLCIGLQNFFEGVFEQTEASNRQLEEVIADARSERGLDIFLFEVVELRGNQVRDGVAGIVRAPNEKLARESIREWLDWAMASPQGEYRFRMFRTERIKDVLVTTDFTPIYEGE